jgi:hypothetical protein
MPKILNQAKPAKEMTKETMKIKAALGGHSGSGKTTSAVATLPGKKLLIDYDGRADSIAGLADVDVIQILESNPRSPVAWRKAEALCDDLWVATRAGELKYDVVIEDGLTAMNRYAMHWALLLDPKRGLGGSPAQQHYGPQMKNLADHILKMKALPVHYVLTIHLEMFEDAAEGSVLFLPKMYGKTRTELGTWFNETYYCFHKSDPQSNQQKYFWHTSGFGRMEFFKSAMNNPVGKYWKDPVEIDLEKRPAGFEKLLNLRFGKEEKNG